MCLWSLQLRDTPVDSQGGGGGQWNLYREKIFFLKFLINLCKGSLILEGGNIVLRKFHSPPLLSSSLVLQMSDKEDLKDFEAMTEKKTDFFTQ